MRQTNKIGSVFNRCQHNKKFQRRRGYCRVPVYAAACHHSGSNDGSGHAGICRKGERVLGLGRHAEYQGAFGVVVNAPTPNSTVKELKEALDIPVIVTVVSEEDDIAGRLEAGAEIFNVSAASKTPELIEKIRKKYPDIPIMATGGPTDETIKATIAAGANAVTWTPPTNGEVFKDIMDAYRKHQEHPTY